MNDEVQVPPALVSLATNVGITTAYWDATGTYRDVPEKTLRLLLVAMGVLASVDADVAAIEQALLQEQEAPWSRSLPPVHVIYENEPGEIPLVVPEHGLSERCEWTIELESGEHQAGSFVPSELAAHSVAGDERQDKGACAKVGRGLHLPVLPLGYHRLHIVGLAGETDPVSCHLVVAPRTCHGATATGEADTDRRVWGLALQLYAVVSERNWGMGDFTDLARALEATAELGGDVVGINPLHALFAHDPESASPYSPSSRLFLNPLCIDVEAVEGWAEVRTELAAAGHDLATRLPELRKGELIDYSAVAQLKSAALEGLWKQFSAQATIAPETQGWHAFRAFRQREGQPLERFAVFEALREHLDRQGEVAGDWRQWPERLRTPDSPEVEAFATTHRARIDFHAWQQWVAAEQLDAASAAGRAAGLGVGLYRDLAVGISAGGGDAWGDQSLFAAGIHVGAPPDDFSANGQDWGLPPLQPRALATAGYAPFAAILRANMHAAGAIRIDHVMGLARLFWIPAGESPAQGAYVNYPLRDMLAIVALESRRAACIVIGEDLGTVPEGFREALAEAGVLSYRLMYFEKHYEDDQRFRAPREYPPQSLVGADTHDLPTLRGFWSNVDLDLRRSLDLFPEPHMHEHQSWARGEDRQRLLEAMKIAGVLPNGVDLSDTGEVVMDDSLVIAIHRFLAQSRSRLLLANIEDLLGQVEQMNLPGTDRDVYPNWRRRLPIQLEQWLSHPPLREAGSAMSVARGSNPA